MRDKAAELGLSRRYSGSGLYAIVPGVPPAKPLNIHFEVMQLLDAINAVFRVAKDGLWIDRETHCKWENTFTVYASG
ncbi:MAG TPA: hypothetical protein VFD30_23475 [Terriglobia bacterium]|jgi:hypothetical protein|nr:hypothetical protein [Terriglobia bacterium]